MPSHRGFTLIELLVVIAIIAILAVVVVLTLNPAQLLAQSRDANRVSDMATISSAVSLYQTDVSASAIGTSSVIYTSLPDATSSACADLGLASLPSGYSYHCATTANLRLASSSGWLPLNFQNISAGAPFGSVPIDPINSSSTGLYYTYDTSNGQYEVTAPMESSKYKVGGASDVISGDGGLLATVYEKGTTEGLEPLDYGDPTLVGYWPLNEGTGGTAYDDAGSGGSGIWQGTASGTSGYYSPGYGRQTWAGSFVGNNSNYTAGPILPNVSGPFTATIWIDPTGGGTGVAATTDFFGNVTYRVSGFALGYSSSTLELFAEVMTPGSYTTMYTPATSTLVTMNQWQQVAFTDNGTIGTFYINGTQVGSAAMSSLIGSTTTVEVGYCGGQGGQNFFTGLLQDARIYNTVLSPSQIQALYTGKK